jgi:transcriptional regulator with XRE-family HTH domain/tetratricopeptide (TPR) repeat protein
MAKRLDLTKGHLSGVENGSVRPSQALLEKYEHELGLNPGELSQIALTQLLQKGSSLSLREAREERGWSQEKLAELIGITPVTISRWEHGSHFPSPYFRQKLSEVLGKTPAELGLVPPPLPSVSKIWNVPIARNPYFTGREDLLAFLHERLSTARTTTLTQAQALFGLGGIGKTQTATEYAFRYGDEYTHVFWVLAANRETLIADIVTLAQLLDLPEKDEQDQQQIVAAVKHWLATHEGWLLIMDNADDLPLTQEFLPSSHQGYVLFTTRAQSSGMIAASIEVEKLDLQDSILLLLRWTKRLDMDATLEDAQITDREVAARIVREVDGLPLALIQAAAYIEETDCSLEDYLDLYTTYRKELLARRSHFLIDYPETITTTWSLSFQRVEQQSLVAADILRLCAFLAPDAIPEELLTRGSSVLGSFPGAEASDPFKLNEALEVLHRYSLVRRDANAHLLSIHRLVQAVLKDSLDQQTQQTWAEWTVRIVNAAFPDAGDSANENQRYYLQYYMPHIQECTRLIEQYQLYIPEAARLLHQAGVFLYFHGFYSQSHSLHQQALAIRKQVFGSEHAAVADSLNALALLARFQGDYEQAEKFHRQALTIREKTLGPKHPATAQSLNNLAVLYRNQGKYEQAEPLLQQALSIREQVLGSDHHDTLYSFINLAKLYIEQGKYEQAEPFAKQAVAASERVLEPGHHLIAQSLNLLARLAYERGNYEQAEAFWKRALAIVEQTFGIEHPSTAERLDNLAELFVALGRFTEAESLCRKALNICERVLGSEHPDTITYREHLNRIVSKKEAEQE